MLRKTNFPLVLLIGCLLASTTQAGIMKNPTKGLRQMRRGARNAATHMKVRTPKPHVETHPVKPVRTPSVNPTRTPSVKPTYTPSLKAVRVPTKKQVATPNLRVAHKTLRLLNQRVSRTFNTAMRLQESGIRPITEGPTLRRSAITNISLMSAKRMYPDKPFLQHPVLGARLAEAYFLAQNNRLLIKHLREMKTFWPKFTEAIPRFYQEAQALKQPENLVEWTAQQITPEIKDLFIGEVHLQHEIPQFVSELLPRLHAQNPNRKIFLFTEFLSDNPTGTFHIADFLTRYPKKHYYYPVWEKAHELNITIVGLEVSTVQTLYPVKVVDASGKISHVPSGVVPEGMRIRNDHWWKIIQKYRKENPDALFITYTGSSHSFYNYPSSLAKRTPKKNTLMLEMTMDEIRDAGNVYSKTDNLEMLDEGLSFPQRALKWSSPDLVELSGFDIRIKLPTTEKPRELLERDVMPFDNLDQWPIPGL